MVRSGQKTKGIECVLTAWLNPYFWSRKARFSSIWKCKMPSNCFYTCQIRWKTWEPVLIWNCSAKNHHVTPLFNNLSTLFLISWQQIFFLFPFPIDVVCWQSLCYYTCFQIIVMAFIKQMLTYLGLPCLSKEFWELKMLGSSKSKKTKTDFLAIKNKV